jgi:uncharacterized protein YeaO (DUF488 family)
LVKGAISILKIKRVYQEAGGDDGYRILVDRLWPRGLAKEKASIDYWAKEISPSHAIRKSFKHEAGRFEDFKNAYTDELDTNQQAEEFLNLLGGKLRVGNVTLLFAAKNETINHAVVLKEWIEENLV